MDTLKVIPKELTQEALDEQLRWEEEMTTRGINRYRKALVDAKARGSEASLPPVVRLMIQSVQPVAEAIDAMKGTLNKPGPKHKALVLIKDLPSDEVALIVAKLIMQGVSRQRGYISLASTLGALLEEQMAYLDFKNKDKHYWGHANKKAQTYSSDQRRRLSLRGYAKHAQVWQDRINSKDKIAIGSYLIKLFADNTGLVKLVDVPKQQTIIDITDKCSEYLRKANDRCEILTPVFLPMLVTPNAWQGMYGGGYFTKRIPLIKTNNKGYLDDPLNIPSEEVLSAINAAQGTAWAINRDVYAVASSLWETGSTIADLPSREHYELPEMPCSDSEVEAYKQADPAAWYAWKQKRKEVHLINARLRSNRIAVGQTLESAGEMLGQDAFWFPWTLDWRGRMYPVAGALSPQGGSLSKGLLQFAEGKPLGTSGVDWLKITLANAYGVDKVSYEERKAWVAEHDQIISMCALDPYTFKFWSEADSPWEFLAACFEWERFKKEGEAMISYLPVRVDGSCNGLQHLSAALLDPVGAAATNLSKGSKPSDIYAQVASIVSTKVRQDASDGHAIAQDWEGKVTRSVVKRNVMTVSYGATRIGMLEQLRVDLNKAHGGKVREWLGLSDDAPIFEHYRYLSDLIRDAIAAVVKAAPEVMTWVQDVAVLAAEDGLPLRWDTPAGFKVLHAYRKTKEERINCVIGSYRIQTRLRIEDQAMNPAKTKLAIAPNWVHSLDAAHCHLTMHQCLDKGVTSFAMVHDSYGCHACDMDTMSDVLRQVFVDMYSKNQMLNLLDQVKAQVSPELGATMPLPPQQGGFGIEAVKDSRYFFA